ncbi:uncharacterized protein LOC100891521 [Strongylocentrotus purpuratus]|uniref:Uncharacterized protein n=1 Tax=Strongylocentrotus purpuratus TaxID=7668 RepID=A0A7M7NFH3_STRPU|nr:uncharacterized protein LOC100891521 [Strongylocentrotus purpuratus]
MEKLVEKFDIGSLNLIVAELIEDSQGELESERTKADLYEYLCEWKESSSGSAISLYSAMEKNNLEYEDFLASIDNAVSDDDLEHICWHVHSCRETVQPIVDSLQYSSTNSTEPADSGHISAPSRGDKIWDDLQIMKRWKAMSAATTYGEEDEHTESVLSNRMIQLCRALEEAGKKTRDSDGRVYHQLSKTFYKIQGKYKSELTDEVLKEFALNITKRHCQRLGKPFRLSARAIANRNEEDLEMLRTDIMLKAWVLDQNCSNYEIRRRLRQAAEQCERQDIADIFIRKKQSEVMTSPIQLTITNENQSPGASRSESVTSISRDELNRIGRYAGSAVLCAFCKKYGVTVPEQQSPDGKELLCEIINVLKPTLDFEFERIKKEKKSSTPRITLRQLLENEHPHYACLLAMKKPFNIFDVELIDLAFRLIMADVYPFAKALNISDQVLNSYRRIIRPSVLTQGTANIIKQVSIKERGKMITPLKQAGYSEEARALYFGFEISLGDVIEVEKRVNMAQLTKQLGISDDVQSTEPGNQVKPVLLKWRDTVHSSTFNHRLVLADALFSMEEEQLALDIISGVHRNRVINKPMLELLAATVPEGQVPTYEVMDQKTKNEKGLVKWSAKSPTESSNKLLGAGCYAFAYENMAVFHHGTDTGNVTTKERRHGSIAINKPVCNKGGKGGKETKEGMEKATNGDTLIDNTCKEGTRKGLEQVAKDNHTIPTEGMQEANTTEEDKGGSQNSEDKNSLGKEATDTNNVIAEISREEKIPSLTNEEVMQEKSRDGAAESKENITENIDTKEQGNTPDGSDECKQDESSKLLTQAGT